MTERSLATGPDPISTTPSLPNVTQADSARRRQRPSLVLAVLTCQLMLVLDLTVMNVALPRIQAGLHFSPTGAWQRVRDALSTAPNPLGRVESK